MLKRICSLALIAALLLGVPVHAQTAEVQSAGSHRYKAVRLTPEVYHGARGDLSDLRVKNSAGQEVPYFIHTGGTRQQQQTESVAMELLDAYKKDDAFYFDYALGQPPDGDALATSLVFETKSNNFAKEVTLSGSYDNRHWETVQDDTLYHVDDKAKLEIVFAAPQKYTHYRLRLGNNLEEIAFDRVKLCYNNEETQTSYLRESLQPHFTTEQAGKDTLLHVEGLKNLKLDSMTLETDNMFRRKVSDPFGGSKELYNLSFERVAYKDMTLPLDSMRSTADIFTLKISNHDDAPIVVKNITVHYYADEVVFAAGDETRFTLQFGDAAATAPVYDIVSYKADILQGDIDRLSLGAVVSEPQPEAVKEVDYTLIFNIVISLTAVLLGALILMRMRRHPK